MRQLSLLKKQKSAYGGELMKTRAGRAGPRPLATRATMHLVLRSSKATGKWSFRHGENPAKIRALTTKFAARHGVKILSAANVGNHLHFHIKLGNRLTYRPFIRALTAAIAMAVTNTNRWTQAAKNAAAASATPKSPAPGGRKRLRFWDYRPFTRVVESFRAWLNLRDYLLINELEGQGCARVQARFILAWRTPGG
jgi:hypothetical protein